MPLLRRVLNLFSRSQIDRDIDDEFELHIAMRIEDNLASGLSPAEARREAMLRFGNRVVMKDRVASADVAVDLGGIGRDIRYALQQLRRSFGFATAAVVTLALGIGSATAIFSVVKAVILNPLPFRQPGNLVHLWEGTGTERYRQGDQAYFSSVRPGNFFDWRTQSQSFESMSAFRWQAMFLTASDRAELVSAQEVYDGFFETLGTPALLGRSLQVSDYRPGSGHVAVISYRMWKQRYASDPGVIGRRIPLDRDSFEIVGVMPAGFFPTNAGYAELWTPHWASQTEQTDRVTWGWFPIARLKPGVTWQQAQTELFLLSARITADYPTEEKVHAIVVPMSAQLIGTSWKLLLLLSGGVVLLLLVACVNVANLILARAVDRDKEFAIRTSLGASRARLASQLLVESLVFAVVAAAVGLGVAAAGTSGLLALLPQADTLPRLDSIKIDLGTLAFVCLLTLLTSLSFSLIPMLHMSRNRPNECLKTEGRNASAGKNKRRLGQILIVSEFVFSLVLLILGASLVESFLKLQRVDPGFDTSHLLVFRITVPDVSFGKFIYGEKAPARERLFERLEQVVDAVPGVESAALTERLPLRSEVNPSGVQIEGHVIPSSGSEGDASTGMVNPAFMQALRLKVIRGRFLDEHDNATAPVVAVVNESFVRVFLLHEDPIGKRAKVWYANALIVGVVADFKFNALDRQPFPEIFWSLRQTQARNVWIMARTRPDTSLVTESVRKALREFDPDLPVQEMHPMVEVVADSLWLKRLSAVLIGVVAVMAIVLAATGIFSIMSYAASQRRKEMGIRMAFGASRRDIFGLIMGETCRLALFGSALGCIAAFLVARVVMSMSYLSPGLVSTQSHEPLHPAAFILSSAFLSAIAICATFVPAQKALSVDPAIALRHE